MSTEEWELWAELNTINRLFLDKRNIVNLSLISITLVDPIQRVEVKQILDFKLKYLWGEISISRKITLALYLNIEASANILKGTNSTSILNFTRDGKFTERFKSLTDIKCKTMAWDAWLKTTVKFKCPECGAGSSRWLWDVSSHHQLMILYWFILPW